MRRLRLALLALLAISGGFVLGLNVANRWMAYAEPDSPNDVASRASARVSPDAPVAIVASSGDPQPSDRIFPHSFNAEWGEALIRANALNASDRGLGYLLLDRLTKELDAEGCLAALCFLEAEMGDKFLDTPVHWHLSWRFGEAMGVDAIPLFEQGYLSGEDFFSGIATKDAFLGIELALANGLPQQDALDILNAGLVYRAGAAEEIMAELLSEERREWFRQKEISMYRVVLTATDTLIEAGQFELLEQIANAGEMDAYPYFREKALMAVFGARAHADLESSRQWIETVPDPSIRSGMRAAYLDRLGSAEAAAEYLLEIGHLPASEAERLRSSTELLAESDPQTARRVISTMEPGPVRDVLLKSFLSTIDSPEEIDWDDTIELVGSFDSEFERDLYFNIMIDGLLDLDVTIAYEKFAFNPNVEPALQQLLRNRSDPEQIKAALAYYEILNTPWRWGGG